MLNTKFLPVSVAQLARLAMVAGAAVGLTACSDMATPPSKLGDLGRGSFKYRCVSDDDAVCPASAKDLDYVSFPTSIATGGRFKLSFTPNSANQSAVGNAVLKPASTEFLNDDSLDFFVAKRPGRVAVIARSSSTGRAADLTYVRIANPKKVRILNETKALAPPTLDLQVGEVLALTADARGDRDEALAGTIDFEWASDNSDALALEAGNPAARMTFKAKTPGKANLEVKLGTVSTKIEVTVKPQ